MEKYQKLVYFSILKMLYGQKQDAEDLTQEVFISAYRSLRHFRMDSSFSTWILKIATNKVLDFKRKKQLSVVRNSDTINHIPAQDDPLREIIDREFRSRQAGFIQKLPIHDQQVIEDFYFKQLSCKEIAAKENITSKTVQTRLYRARLKLKKLWKEEPGDEM